MCFYSPFYTDQRGARSLLFCCFTRTRRAMRRSNLQHTRHFLCFKKMRVSARVCPTLQRGSLSPMFIHSGYPIMSLVPSSDTHMVSYTHTLSSLGNRSGTRNHIIHTNPVASDGGGLQKRVKMTFSLDTHAHTHTHHDATIDESFRRPTPRGGARDLVINTHTFG